MYLRSDTPFSKVAASYPPTPPNSSASKDFSCTRYFSELDTFAVRKGDTYTFVNSIKNKEEILRFVQTIQLEKLATYGRKVWRQPWAVNIKVPYQPASEFINEQCENDSLNIKKFEYYDRHLRLQLMGGAKPHHDISPRIMIEKLEDFKDLGYITRAMHRRVKPNLETFKAHGVAGVYDIIPDVALVSFSHHNGRWPIILWEVGNSQSYEDLIEKKSHWFHGSQGAVRAVILMKFVSDNPVEDPTCILQV
ncbi:hypothetical protein K440DRAFT_197092 [Wilcoxina mikolae CBS 423.85]|nr:hypothetical protein K440DRAFT_197092 [Wilcoxina mikolae CBS 423.85]